MATEKWVGGSGQGLTWGTIANSTVSFGALASGNAVLGDIAVTNGTALDIFADFSFVGSSSVTIAAPAYIGVYLYPLNSDGSTYGDGRFGSAAAGPPPSNYYAGSIGFSTGAAAPEGSITGVVMPPGTWKVVIYNQLGATFPSTQSGATFQYRTYNRSIA